MKEDGRASFHLGPHLRHYCSIPNFAMGAKLIQWCSLDGRKNTNISRHHL